MSLKVYKQVVFFRDDSPWHSRAAEWSVPPGYLTVLCCVDPYMAISAICRAILEVEAFEVQHYSLRFRTNNIPYAVRVGRIVARVVWTCYHTGGGPEVTSAGGPLYSDEAALLNFSRCSCGLVFFT